MTSFPEYEQYDALGLAELVKWGKVSPPELLEAAIERVEARNPIVNAVVMKLYDHGRKAIADGLPEGPFRGVPFLMKDLTASLAGVPMTRGSKFFADSPPAAADSEHVKRLKRAGLVIFGRTNTCELGLSLTCEPRQYGPTRNPWDPSRISGGSSGGAAAAVGSRMLPMAHATDGFGSIRAPAACCGLVGLKPTRARNTMAPFTGEGLARTLGRARGHALGARQCRVAGRDRRTRPGRSLSGGGRHASVRPGDRRRSRQAAHRLHVEDAQRRAGGGGEPARAAGDGAALRRARPYRGGSGSGDRWRRGGADLPHPRRRQYRGEPRQPPDRGPARARGRGGDGDVGRRASSARR